MKVCVGDLEADGLLDTATRAWCGVFIDINTKEVFQFRPHQIQEMLQFMDTVEVLIIQNGIGYDWPLLQKLYGYTYKGKKVDALVMSRLLNPKRILPPNCPNRKAGPHSIEAWGWRLGRGKPEHDDWSQFSEEMLHRCTEDAWILLLMYEALLKEAANGSWRNAFLMSFELFTYLQEQEEYGWLVDQEHMKWCVHILTRWIERIDKVIVPYLPLILEVEEQKVKGEYKYVQKPFLKSGKYSESVCNWHARNNLDPLLHSVGGPFTRVNFRVTNLDSGDETKDFLLRMGWEPLEWNTNDDGERTSPKLSKDDPFEGIEGRIGKLVAKRVQCKQRRGIIEGLFELIRPDGRVASVVNSLAVTGRATHRGIVNIPKAGSFFGKQMRKMFSSKEGFVLVGTDSAGNQLRQLAARMNDPVYTKALVEGKKEDGSDNHSLTAKIGELESRDVAKNVIYCLLFGGGDAKLAKTAKKPVGSGADLRAKLYRGFDGLGKLMEMLTSQWRKTAKRRWNQKWNKMEYYDGTIIGLDNRPIRVPYEHQLLVYLLQSDEAIHMAMSYIFLARALHKKYKWGIDYGIVCWYHDEYTVECREEIAEDVKKMSEDAIREAGEYFKITCPHEGQGAIGKNWYAIH